MRGNKTLESSSSDDDVANCRGANARSAGDGAKEPKRKREVTTNGEVKPPTKLKRRKKASSKASTPRSRESNTTQSAVERKPVIKAEEVKVEVKNEVKREVKEVNGVTPVKDAIGQVQKVKSKVKDEKPKPVYSKMGQTRQTPEETDPKRKFYYSLWKENPQSEMARKWCTIHGLLTDEELSSLLNSEDAKKQKKQPEKKPVQKRRPSKTKRVSEGEVAI